MRQTIAGNWKMHGLTREAAALATALLDAGPLTRDLLVSAPPRPKLPPSLGFSPGRRSRWVGRTAIPKPTGHTPAIYPPLC